jgi:glycolate oxidase FAD binding subunit
VTLSALQRLETDFQEHLGRLAFWGGEPLPTLSPASVDELQEILRQATRDELVALPLGLGSKLDWACLPTRVDFALSTRRLRGVIEFEPAEGTLTAWAGTPLEELRRLVAAEGFHLTPDVPLADRATLGGAIAAGQSGADRLGLGPLRDHVLGTRIARGDGTLIRSGGRLVKNVAGYELHRLCCGAHGALGLIVDASLRLFPEPASRVIAERPYEDLEAALAAALQLVRGRIDLRALRVDGSGSRWQLIADVRGPAGHVDREVDRVRAVLGSGCRTAGGETAARLLDDQREALRPQGQWPLLEVQCRPSRLAKLVAALRGAWATVDAGAQWVIEPGLARVAVYPSRPELPELALRGVHEALAGAGWTPRWRGLAAELGRELCPRPRGLELMRLIRRQLDPLGRFAGGRLHPEL